MEKIEQKILIRRTEKRLEEYLKRWQNGSHREEVGGGNQGLIVFERM